MKLKNINFTRKTDPNQKLGCCCVIANEDNTKILMGKRTDGKGWCVPGGKIDMYETPDEAVDREVFEEVGLRIKNTHFVGVFELNGITDYVFYTQSYEGEPSPALAEFSELKWFTVEDCGKHDLFEFTIPMLEMLAGWTIPKN